MNCPKCGSEIHENQKFCGNCGAEIKFEDTQDIEQKENGFKLNNLNKKIIAIVSLVILILALAFGIIQYKQYQEDIKPYETSLRFVDNNDVICTLNYDKQGKFAHLSMLHKGIVIEQWQIDASNEYKNNYSLTSSNNTTRKYQFYFSSSELKLGKPLVLNFKITDIKNSKDFTKLKKDFNNIGLIRSLPKMLSEDTKIRLEGKKEWLKWKKEIEAQKEAERKQKEWQEKILSNCVYKTSDGVCFTTPVFKPEPLNYYDCTGGLTTYNVAAKPTDEIAKLGIQTCYHHYDAWAGAKKQCDDWGFKLPTKEDLASLAKDIFKAKISNDSYTTTYLPDGQNVNKEPYKALTNFVGLWEDTDKDTDNAYVRYFFMRETKRATAYKTWVDGQERAVCVYNPNGIAKSTYKKDFERKQQEQIKKQQQENEQRKQGVENDLF